MHRDEMILVSVDDHVCEPPNMREGRLAAQWKDRAPRLVHKRDGGDVCVFEGQQIPNLGVNAVAGRPLEEYGMEPTALEQLRAGCYDIDARVADMSAGGILGSLCFPSFPGSAGGDDLRDAPEDTGAAISATEVESRVVSLGRNRRAGEPARRQDGPAEEQ